MSSFSKSRHLIVAVKEPTLQVVLNSDSSTGVMELQLGPEKASTTKGAVIVPLLNVMTTDITPGAAGITNHTEASVPLPQMED